MLEGHHQHHPEEAYANKCNISNKMGREECRNPHNNRDNPTHKNPAHNNQPHNNPAHNKHNHPHTSQERDNSPLISHSQDNRHIHYGHPSHESTSMHHHHTSHHKHSHSDHNRLLIAPIIPNSPKSKKIIDKLLPFFQQFKHGPVPAHLASHGVPPPPSHAHMHPAHGIYIYIYIYIGNYISHKKSSSSVEANDFGFHFPENKGELYKKIVKGGIIQGDDPQASLEEVLRDNTSNNISSIDSATKSAERQSGKDIIYNIYIYSKYIQGNEKDERVPQANKERQLFLEQEAEFHRTRDLGVRRPKHNVYFEQQHSID